MICYVYVDDVIIFSKTKEDHVKYVDWVLTRLLETGMRVSQEKSKFIKKNVEYLGFIVCHGGLRTSPEKVKAIRQFPPP